LSEDTKSVTSPAGKELVDLLRGELAAVETYDQALDAWVGDPDTTSRLRRIRADHMEAVAELRAFVREAGGDDEATSGVWGAVAAAVEGTARLLGDAAALRALREGEQLGLRQYEDFRAAAGKNAEWAEFGDRQRDLVVQHVTVLEQLLGSA